MTTTRDELVEAMAEAAHEAWMEGYRAMGLTSRRAEWGEEFMVPWDDLSERGRELDRIILRGVFERLDAMGVLRVGPDVPAAGVITREKMEAAYRSLNERWVAHNERLRQRMAEFMLLPACLRRDLLMRNLYGSAAPIVVHPTTYDQVVAQTNLLWQMHAYGACCCPSPAGDDG